MLYYDHMWGLLHRPSLVEETCVGGCSHGHRWSSCAVGGRDGGDGGDGSDTGSSDSRQPEQRDRQRQVQRLWQRASGIRERCARSGGRIDSDSHRRCSIRSGGTMAKIVKSGVVHFCSF